MGLGSTEAREHLLGLNVQRRVGARLLDSGLRILGLLLADGFLRQSRGGGGRRRMGQIILVRHVLNSGTVRLLLGEASLQLLGGSLGIPVGRSLSSHNEPDPMPGVRRQ